MSRVVEADSVILHNAVRPPSVDLAGIPRKPVVAVLQRLEPEKMTEVAIQAFAGTSLSSTGWRLRIAGEGSEEATLRELARRLEVDQSVDFLGAISNTYRFLSESQVFIATGRADAFGLSLAEAMAVATPAIASNGGAHPEVLGPDGMLFPVGDWRAAADLLQTLASRPTEQLHSYGQMLRARQRTLFDMDAHLTTLRELYDQAAQRGRRHSGNTHAPWARRAEG